MNVQKAKARSNYSALLLLNAKQPTNLREKLKQLSNEPIPSISVDNPEGEKKAVYHREHSPRWIAKYTEQTFD